MLSLLIIGDRHYSVLGAMCCTTGDAFACFFGRIFWDSRVIRNGKSVAGFLGAGVATAVHAVGYVYFCGYFVEVGVFAVGLVFVGGFFIGGISDFLPSREIGLDDNFTAIIYGSFMWWGYATVISGYLSFG